MKINTIEDYLREKLKGWSKLIICGIGNEIKGDDVAGSKLAQILIERLKTKNERIKIFDCKETPESFLEKIIAEKPTHILIVDAAFLNEEPGTIRVLSIDNLEEYTASTHNVPLNVLVEYISKRLGYMPTIIIVGIQPKTLELGENPSKEVLSAVMTLAKIIEKVIKEKGV